MTGIRRVLILIGLTLVIIVGASIPASATFADSVTAKAAVTTGTVTAPAWVSTEGTECAYWRTWNSYWGRWDYHSELRVRVSWPASTTTREVTGYRLTAVLADGSEFPVGDVPSWQQSITGNFPIEYAHANIQVTVTTLTSYGWTQESAPSAVITC